MTLTEHIARVALRKVVADTYEDCATLADELAARLRAEGCHEAAGPCEGLARMYRSLASGKGAPST